MSCLNCFRRNCNRRELRCLGMRLCTRCLIPIDDRNGSLCQGCIPDVIIDLTDDVEQPVRRGLRPPGYYTPPAPVVAAPAPAPPPPAAPVMRLRDGPVRRQGAPRRFLLRLNCPRRSARSTVAREILTYNTPGTGVYERGSDGNMAALDAALRSAEVVARTNARRERRQVQLDGLRRQLDDDFVQEMVAEIVFAKQQQQGPEDVDTESEDEDAQLALINFLIDNEF